MAHALQIGFRQLRSKKGRTLSVITWIAISGVALGVSALLLVLSITTGFQREFRDKVVGVNAHVLVMKYGVDFEEYRDVIAKAREYEEVEGAGPFLLKPMVVSKGDKVRGVLVKGVDPEGARSVLDLPGQLVAGSLDTLRREAAEPSDPPDTVDVSGWAWLRKLSRGEESPELEEPPPLPEGRTPAWGAPPPRERDILHPEALNALFERDLDLPELDVPDDVELEPMARDEASAAPIGGIVLGKDLAEELGAEVDDRVTLVSPTAAFGLADVGGGRRTQTRELRVIGIFSAGFQEYDSRLAYVDLYDAQPFYGQGDVVTGVELRLRDLDEAREVARRLERELGGPFHTLDWAELNENLFTALQIQKIALAFVVATIIFVAAFNVIVTLIMVVLERRREIAILKAMGAPSHTILGVFSLQGMVVGIAGTGLGLVLGAFGVLYLDRVRIALDPKVYLIDHLPVVTSPMEFVQAAAAALTICALSTLAPSLWAARSLPVEGLHKD
jgi:lipoprotein-releasing system permease protein